MRASNMMVTGIDATAVLQMASALGYDLLAVAEFFPTCEMAMTSAINEKIAASVDC